MRKSNQRRAKGLIFVVCGPSGSGKTTLLERLLKDKDLKGKLVKSISLTTRPKRSREQEGRDYFFIDRAEFQRQQKAKKILEWTKYLGYYYATPLGFAERQFQEGRHLILCLDLKGAAKIKEIYPRQGISIFVVPPSLKVLKERIQRRCAQTRKEEVKKRLGLAREELAAAQRHDYRVVNQNLSQAQEALKEIILKEIHLRESLTK